jgi:chorismate--pyruvate lyase
MNTLSKQSLLFAREPAWTVCRKGNYRHIPPAARSWLFEAGSITRRLRSGYGDALAVKVLRQHWGKPFPGEKRLLNQARQRRCLIREVLLHSGGKPLVLARTVMPSATLRGAHRNLTRLGSRPLGEVIFSYPDLQRLEMHVALVKPDDWSRQLATQVPIAEPLWGRRTVYAIHHRQLLVSEFFLPELVGRL